MKVLSIGFKFAGIATWLLYFVRYSAGEVRVIRGAPYQVHYYGEKRSVKIKMLMEKAKQVLHISLDQLRTLWKFLLFLYLPIILFFVLLGSISRASGDLTLSYFTRDISAVGGLPFYAGVISQIGGLFWSAALAICLFTYIILRRQDAKSSRRFLLHAALLTAVLLLDDFFLFHEDIGPDYLHIGEKAIVLFYLLLCIGFLLFNINEILSSEFMILGVALALFGLSIFIDAVDLDEIDLYERFINDQLEIFVEDGLKFLGVATWLAYFARYGYQKIVSLDRKTSSAS